ncbi:MAG TPA: response regulator [Blastocatellia bacterium]|nr:response regulator [Blastocatellia bacterium]
MASKVLIVEDDFDTRYVLSLVLKAEGYVVVTAADGECALGVAAEQQPDLVITDVKMPRLDGIELTRRLRSDPQTAATPILVITAYGETPLKRALAAGASACARKPIVVDELLTTVKALLT